MRSTPLFYSHTLDGTQSDSNLGIIHRLIRANIYCESMVKIFQMLCKEELFSACNLANILTHFGILPRADSPIMMDG